MKLWLVLLLGCLLVLVGCGEPTATPVPTATPTAIPCSVQAAEFLAALEEIEAEWDDAELLASQTQRIALSPQIDRLQEIRRRVQSLDAPECAEELRTNLVDYMDGVIDAYLAFLSDEPDEVVNELFEQALEYYQWYTIRKAKLEVGE